MATVYAYKVGCYVRDFRTGWSHCFSFRNLGDLADKLSGISNITRLGIDAHGNEEGVVFLDEPPLSWNNYRSYADSLGMLGICHLEANAKLVFYSCRSARGWRGSQLLARVSDLIPGRIIIGFNVDLYGSTAQIAACLPAGTITEQPVLDMQRSMLPGTRIQDVPPASPWSQYAKWARNGRVIRLPLDERRALGRNRCAAPGCPGHRSLWDECTQLGL
jgi:Domain of unknown function (DUF4347)